MHNHTYTYTSNNNNNASSSLTSRLSFRWVARGVIALVLLNALVQFQFYPRRLSLHRAARCTPYDPVASPGVFHLLGATFNITPHTHADTDTHTEAADSLAAVAERLFKGKGVVMTASGNITRQAAGAFVTAYVIRHVLKEDIPIEIFYAGEEEAFHGPILTALQSLPAVHLRDLEATLSDYHHEGLLRSIEPLPALKTLKGYAAKLYAMQASSFQEAILFDAGAVPFVTTSRFFALPSYQHHGMALFSDYVSIEKARWGPILKEMCLDLHHISKTLGGRELDSSCVVLDKRRNADALAVAVALNGPLQSMTYEHLWGDKDTWALGMFYVGKAVSVQELEPGYLLVERGERGMARKVTGHLQFLKDKSSRDPPGLVAMHHNNQLLDLREFPLIQNETYMEIFSHLGDVLLPVTRRRDCRHFPTGELMRLPLAMQRAYVAVSAALKEHGIDHCVCRDDWISCEADIERVRRKWWALRWIDSWAPRRKKEERAAIIAKELPPEGVR